MIYVALLRGINVGGKTMVNMTDLKAAFEAVGLQKVRSYINSGNIIFQTSEPRRRLPQLLEQRLQLDLGLAIRVLLRSLPEVEALTASIPAGWVNDDEQKCDVIFLWPEVDEPGVIDQLAWDSDYESLRYLPGALVWHTTKTYAQHSQVSKLNRLPLYQNVTVRNPNTVRKLLTLMQDI